LTVAAISKRKLGSTIKRQREKVKLSLRKVASECEISPAALSDIENGIIFPSEKTFLRLIEVINFKDKSKVCDFYAKLKGTVPPDVVDFLNKNRPAVEEVRQRMKEGEEAKS
jgi:transcriptional regulator with XRE-family HTH domain